MNASRLRRGLSLPAAERWLAVEGLAMLAVSRAVLALLPFRIAMRWLGLRLDRRTGIAVDEAGETPATPSVLLVGTAVRRAAAIAPFRAVCLQQAVAAALMLRRRGHKAQVHFGVTRDHDGMITAHAWTRCQGQVVTGEQGMARYRPISVFVT
ncbi:hypothetical protein CKO38_05665 [Rhodospirillum rubrum]|uniref:lasso peptide biosynthesis B2 protein n=1 Tax=Rhodospirillum rubrum TaxID=1085 RepID=UPI001905BA94|nr:lasso peptide biosynthesis B2 protein [Rhodospirillum rubrum]MBK1664463.1 hypothetical protein [Rhodospirillum rubrum]MBK1676169.1 hypothetical protein [Rhodospirillum rubrum]